MFTLKKYTDTKGTHNISGLISMFCNYATVYKHFKTNKFVKYVAVLHFSPPPPIPSTVPPILLAILLFYFFEGGGWGNSSGSVKRGNES